MEELEKARDPNSEVIDFTMPMVCDACSDLPDNLKVRCLHMRPLGGIDQSRHSKRKAGMDSDVQTVLRERLAQITTDMSAFYKKEDLDYMKTSINEDEAPAHEYFMGADPNTGGLCETAVVFAKVIWGFKFISRLIHEIMKNSHCCK